MSEKLKPCPFCGGEAGKRKGKRWYCQLHGEPNDPIIIHCKNQNCPIKPTVTAISENPHHVADAEKRWNTRAQPEAVTNPQHEYFRTMNVHTGVTVANSPATNAGDVAGIAEDLLQYLDDWTLDTPGYKKMQIEDVAARLKPHLETYAATRATTAEADLAKLKHENAGLHKERIEVEDRLGEALGYPLDPDENGKPVGPHYCIGEHVTGTIAHEAANKIKNLEADLAKARDKVAELIALLEEGNQTYLGAECVVCFKPDVLNNALTTARNYLERKQQ